MSGFINNGVPQLSIPDEEGLLNIDTQYAAGRNPESASLSMLRLATMLSFFQNYTSAVGVSGTVYYRKFTIAQSIQLTGLEFLIGATGGTDKVIGYVFDSTGAAVGSSALAGATVGTAGTWQQLAFTAPLTLAAGDYYLAIQLNGTTATFQRYNAPGLALITGSKTGTFGTQGTITPATTYTAAVGPVIVPYQ